MRQSFDEELQISEFIKDPGSLKLLILAGTNIRANQLGTVNKCVSLIKLDLSSNQLAELPLKFSSFPQLKILYLHDNRISAISITRTNLQYISLFGNPISNYRNSLIEGNERLMAIDHHVISKSERVLKEGPRPMAALKWPIVQISQSLQHQQDYLNLLKAELFVISQVHKRANFADTLNRYFITLSSVISFTSLRHSLTNQAFFHRQFIHNAAQHWRQYTKKKQKLRKFLEGTPAEDLLLNKLERVRRGRSAGVSQVLRRFLHSIRERMVARLVLGRSLAAYRHHIPAYRQMRTRLEEDPLKIYFLQSQQYFLEKLILYAKKHFFNLRQFDILDHFDQLVIKAKRSYYVFRRRDGSSDTILLEMIRNAMGLVLGQKGVDKRSVLYNRQGHKRIQIKRVKGHNEQWDKQRTKKACGRVQQLYNRYDTLFEYEFKHISIYQTVMRLIKYFNAGNSHLILQNQAAYFQTEVVLEDKAPPKQHIFFTSYYYFRRVAAANAIQKWWRRVQAVRASQRNIFREIRVSRAQKLLGRWLRDLTFRHKMQLSKLHSFTRYGYKEIELLMQLDIYMHLPVPSDLLRHARSPIRPHAQALYQLLHRNTEVEIVEVGARSWIKFRFLGPQEAFEVQRQLSLLTYRYYYNGTFLKLFTAHELNSLKELSTYQDHVRRLFGVKVTVGEQGRTAKRIQVDNAQPYFIWPYLQEGFAGMFKAEEVQSLPISVFIYNKNRRPLKVNCDLMWITPPTLYHYRRRVKPQVRVRTPKKEKQPAESALEHYMPHIQHKLRRERQFSMKQHKSLLQANRQRGHSQHVQLSLLSETLNIKRQ